MARVNVYLPDELANAARSAGLNVSNVTQEALRRELASRTTAAWLLQLQKLPPTEIEHDEALRALDAARDESGGRLA
jgi:post-segregation antitoxin (ccd killing protein)